MTKLAGDNQTVYWGSVFPTALSAAITDSFGNPIANTTIVFTVAAGGSGATGTFNGATTIATGASGIATAPTLTANSIAGSFTVTASGGGFSVTFTLNIQAPVFTLGSTSGTVGPTAGTATAFEAVTPTTASWTASSNSSWLHVSSGSASGTGSAVITYTYDTNPATGPRTGTLTIGSQTFTVTQAGSGWAGSAATPVLLASGLSSSGALTIDRSGNVYICSGNSILEWSPVTQQVTPVVSSGLTVPQAVAVDAQGNIYIADTNNNAIKKWTASTQQLTTLYTVPNFGIIPNGVALDIAGNVYFSDAESEQVFEWSAATQTATAVFGGLNYPTAIAVDVAGNIYVSDSNNYQIKKWTAATQQVSVIANLVDGATGLTVDGFGNVYFGIGPNTIYGMVNAATGQVSTNILNTIYPYGVTANPQGGGFYFADSISGNLYLVQNTWAGPSPLTEPATAGSDAIQVLPSFVFVPASTSNQTWLTPGANSGGTVGIAFQTNVYTSLRTAQVNVAGATVTVNQSAGVAGAPVGLVKTAGDNQTGDTNSAFSIPLQATVVDQYNNGVPSASVTFAVTPGSGGASGTFSGSATVTTAANGIATAPLLTANGTVGTFTVTATSGSSTVTFTLTTISAVYSLGSPGVTVGPATGSSQVLVVVTPSTAPWNATSNASWLHVTTPAGSGSGLAQFTYDANSGATVRTGTLLLSGQTFTVTQAGASYITAAATSTVVTGLKRRRYGDGLIWQYLYRRYHQ